MGEFRTALFESRTKFVAEVRTINGSAGINEVVQEFLTIHESRGYRLKWRLSLEPDLTASLELTECNRPDLELHATGHWWLMAIGIHCVAINDAFNAAAELPVAKTLQMKKLADTERHMGYNGKLVVEIFVDERIEPMDLFVEDVRSLFDSRIHQPHDDSDVTIVGNDVLFHAHELILSASSNVLADKLRHIRWPRSGGYDKRLELAGQVAHPRILTPLLSFVYAGKSPSDDYQYWPQLVVVATEFDLDELKDAGVRAMCRSLCKTNAMDYLAVALIARAPELQGLVFNLIRAIQRHVRTLVTGEERNLVIGQMLVSDRTEAENAARDFCNTFILNRGRILPII